MECRVFIYGLKNLFMKRSEKQVSAESAGNCAVKLGILAKQKIPKVIFSDSDKEMRLKDFF